MRHLVIQWAAIPVALCLARGTQSTGAHGWRCNAQPIEACFKHHGRLSSQNGIALKIWLIGTTRVVGLDATALPSIVEKYISMTSPDNSYVYGDFTICPLEKDIPGHLRFVCVTDAERLVVENRQGLRRPFRLLSTWPNGDDVR